MAWTWHAGASGNVLIDKNADRVNSYNIWNYAEGHDSYYSAMLVDLTLPPDKVSSFIINIPITYRTSTESMPIAVHQVSLRIQTGKSSWKKTKNKKEKNKCYRIIFGQVNVSMQDFCEFNCSSRTRGHPFKLYKCHSYSSVRASYFANRVINVWNTLPSDHTDF